MEQFAHISIQQTQEKLASAQAKIVDIRDDASFQSAHIAGATQLTNGTLNQFVADTPLDTPVIVVCYHGHSSQQAAQFLIHQGFDEVYSMDGGFEAWRKEYAFKTSHEE